MILITAIIREEEPGGPILIKFNGQDIMGMTDAEGDVADAIKDAMIKKRDEIFAGNGWKKQDLRNSYSRGFHSPEERDRRT